MILRNFDKTDWYGFAGAEDPSLTQPPMIGEVDVPGTMGGIIVLDKNGIEIYVIIKDNPFQEIRHRKQIPFELGRRLVENWVNLPDGELLKVMGFEEEKEGI